MSPNEHDTLIVGAGIAGLACARTLAEAGAPFHVIAEDVGGRIRTSEDGTVNYGAALVSDDYDHVLPFVTRHERLRTRDLYFYRDGPGYPLLGAGILRYGLQPLRVIRELRRFRKSYRRFRERAEHVSQKQAIEADPYLHRLYNQRGSDLARELRVEPFCHRYLCQGLYPLVFASVEEINAFVYLHFLQPLIVPMYTFTFHLDAMTAPFAERITQGSVSAIQEAEGGYRVTASDGVHRARNVVVAAPAHYALLAQRDGSVVVYAHDPEPDLGRFFADHDIVARVHWDPAEFMIGHELVEARRGDGLYMVGDYNVGGVEDAFVTGLYAANQILRAE